MMDTISLFAKLGGILLIILSFHVPLSCQCDCTQKNTALFFAANDYEYLPVLKKPIENARSIAALLKEDFCFDTILVENPSFEAVDDTLRRYRQLFDEGKKDPDSQLLLYFSGHGIVDAGNGYFLAADSDPDHLARTAFPYSILRPQIDEFNCRNMLVAIDACFSVTFDPDWETRAAPRREPERVVKPGQRSRIFFTSDGGQDKTPDRSNFAKKFAEALIEAAAKNEILTSTALFSRIEYANPKPGEGTFGSHEPGTAFQLIPCTVIPSVQVERPVPSASDTTYWSSKKGAYLPVPAGIKIKNKEDQFIIQSDWNTPIWGFVIFLVVATLIMFIVIGDNKESMGCATLIFLTSVLPAGYSVLVGLFNKTDIRIGTTEVVVKSHPLWVWKNEKYNHRTLKREDIRQLFTGLALKTNEEGELDNYVVYWLDAAGDRHVLVSGLSDTTEALFVEQVVEQVLQIPDAVVALPGR